MKKKFMSILLALSMVMGLSVPVFAAESESEHIYLKPVQVAENIWEYRDENGNWVATLEMLPEAEAETVLQEYAITAAGPWSISWAIPRQGSKYDSHKVFSSNFTWTIYTSIRQTNNNESYLGYYMYDLDRYSWFETPSTSTTGFSRRLTIGASSDFSLAIQNAGNSSTTYSGKYNTSPL